LEKLEINPFTRLKLIYGALRAWLVAGFAFPVFAQTDSRNSDEVATVL